MSVFSRIASMDHKVAEVAMSSLSQEEKILFLIVIMLTRFWRSGACSVDDVENDALVAGLTGRCVLQMGKGLGGRGGLQLLRGPNKSILLCSDNIINMTKRLGEHRFRDWLADLGITEEQFDAWFAKLPSA